MKQIRPFYFIVTEPLHLARKQRQREKERGGTLGERRKSILSNSCPHCSVQNVNKQPHVKEVGNCHLDIILGRKINDFSEPVPKIIAIL